MSRLRRLGLCLLVLLLAAPALTAPSFAATPEQLGLPETAAAAERLQRRLAADLEFAQAAGAEAPRDRAALLAELRGQEEVARREEGLEMLAAAGLAQPQDWLSLAGIYLEQRKLAQAEAAAWLAATRGAAPEVETRALLRLAEILEMSRGGGMTVAWLEGLPDALVTGELAERRETLSDRYATRFQQVEVDLDRPRPEVCLVFTGRLAQRQPLPLTDYLELAPEVPVDASLRGERLCLSGLQHGGDYRLNLRAGLLSARGESLPGQAELEVAVGDRTPSVGFQTGAYVLPVTDDPLVPVTSVNAQALSLNLYRVGARNLLSQLRYDDLGRQLSGYDLEALAEREGEAVWQGRMAVPDGPANAEQTTLIPFDEIVPRRAPGIYVLTAGVAEPARETQPWTAQATQWLVVSDLGLSLFEGADGLSVFVRSFADARPLDSVELQLVARNNEVLGRVTSGPDGRARFAAGLLRGEGGNRPAALYATGPDGDFTFIDLEGPALDLSERGVAGRAAPGAVDAFVTPERGIYRPGETVRLTVLLRRDSGLALPDAPLTLSVRRPDGVEAHRTTGRDDGLGGYSFAVPVAEAVPTGLWRAEVYLDPDGAPVGAAEFVVEDFVPQRLELELSADRDRLGAGETAAVTLEGRWLFGAPAADLPIEAEAVVDLDPTPFADYADWTFGLPEEEVSPLRETLPAGRTDAQGRARVEVALPRLPDTAGPLAATLSVSLFDAGGRPVTRRLELPLRPRAAELGLKPRFSEGSVEAGQTAAVDLVALGPDGGPLAGREVRVEWIEVQSDWIPYWQNGTRWRRLVREVPLAQETVTTDAEGRALLQRPLEWGDYKLRVVDAGGAATAVPIRAGWRASAGRSEVPDALEVTPARGALRAGETLEAFVKAPFAGRALVTVLRDRVLHSQEIDLPAEGTTVSLPVAADWGPGAYLAVTAYRPRDPQAAGAATRRAPARAMGAAWFTVDKPARRLQVELSPPAEIRPRRELSVPVTVRGADLAAGGQRAHLVVAAVDEGVLQVTDFATPDPLAHVFAQRRLGLDLRDLYGKLIDPADGPRGRPRSGGGAPVNLAGVNLRSTEVVSLFSGPVSLGPDGTAEVELQVPDFNGRLRVMAMAWSLGGLGAASVPVTVRDPLVADLVLPRFLALGDRAEATLELHNLDGAAGTYRVEVSGGSAVAAKTAERLRLAAGERTSLPVPLTATGLGGERVQLVVTGPDGFALERDWDLEVRAGQPLVTRRSLDRLEPGESRRLDAALAEGFRPDSLDLAVSVSDRVDFGVAGLLSALQRYPYGCAEQTVSRALPLVYLPELAAQREVALDWSPERLRRAVREAVASVLARQTPAGGFGLWTAGGGADLWVSAYAADFLARAAAAGFAVPVVALDRAYGYLAGQAGATWNDDLAGRAYAWQVLARAGRAEPGDLRYFAEQQAAALPTPAARLQLAAALAAVGERERARTLFALAEPDWRRDRAALAAWDYGSPLRDAALAAALLAETGFEAEAWAAAERVAALEARRQRLSTQEQLWMLLAARALTPAGTGDLALSVDGAPVEAAAPLTLRPDAAALAEGVTLTNRGEAGLRVTTTRVGVPDAPLPAASEGLTVARRLLDFQGREIDPGTLEQNDQAVVVLTGRVTDGRAHQALVVDLLPAGVELESVLAGRGTANDGFGFLPELTAPLYEARRDDRYVAALDLAPEGRFVLAYVVRAVTPGDFVLPAPFVEDMYAPEVYARGSLGRLTVSRRR